MVARRSSKTGPVDAGQGASSIRGAIFGAAAILLALAVPTTHAAEQPGNLDFTLEWYESVADRDGQPQLQYTLGQIYEQGVKGDPDPGRAAYWYRRAAEQGLGEAAFKLGLFAQRGIAGPVDLAAARRWYRQAADAGISQARHNLAGLLAAVGGKDNWAEAATLYRQAAEAGLPSSALELGILYAQGLGVPADPVSAMVWVSRAEAGGVAEASEIKAEIVRDLSAEDLREVERRLAEPTG